MADQDVLTGRVTRTSDKNSGGFQLEEYGGEWFNISRYAKNVEMPENGDEIEAELDNQGYVRTLRVTSGGRRPIRNGSARTPVNGQRSNGDRPGQRFATGQRSGGNDQDGPPLANAPTPGRSMDPVAVRLECLREAVRFSAGRTDVKSVDVLKVANLNAAWVLTGKLPDMPSERLRAPQNGRAAEPGHSDEAAPVAERGAS